MTVAALIGIVLILGPAIVNSLTARDPEPPPPAQTAPAATQPSADQHPDAAPQLRGSFDSL